jgi:hypothetical protein
MKRKIEPKEDAIVPVEILDNSRIYFAKEKAKTVVPCAVCGSDTTEETDERLCWVCRRLKISAWRDSESMPAQE